MSENGSGDNGDAPKPGPSKPTDPKPLSVFATPPPSPPQATPPPPAEPAPTPTPTPSTPAAPLSPAPTPIAPQKPAASPSAAPGSPSPAAAPAAPPPALMAEVGAAAPAALAAGEEDEERDAPPPPPMPGRRSRRLKTLEALEIGAAPPITPDAPEAGAAPEEPTPVALRWAGASLALGVLAAFAALTFAAPEAPWIAVAGFVALMLTTVIPARLIAATRSEGRTWVGWLAVWAMTIAAAVAIGMIAWAEVSAGAGIQAVEPLARVAALLALAGLTLAPVLRSVWSLRLARGFAAAFGIWAAAEALLLGVGGALAGPTAAGSVFFDPTGALDGPTLTALGDALTAVGVYAATVWPHAPLLAVIPALLAPRSAGAPFLLLGALYAVAAYAAARLEAGSDPASLYLASVESVRRLLVACVLMTPAVAVAALAASGRRIRPSLLWLAAFLLFTPLLAAEVWSFAAAPTALGMMETPLSEVRATRADLDFVRGVGAIAFLGVVLVSACWLLGLAALGRRSAEA